MRIVPGGPGGLADRVITGADSTGGGLSLADRVQIEVRLVDGCSQAQIAARLGVHRSTICREIARNRDADGSYQALRAHRRAVVRRRRPKPCKLDDPVLRRVVVEALNQRWSPQQIAGHLAQVSPDGKTGRVSHETIYQALYVQGKGALREELRVAKALRSGRKTRRPASKLPARSSRPWITAENHISLRPAQADDRAVPGHWEGDLVIGAGLRSALITLVERSSRFALIGRIDVHEAATVADKLTEMTQALPETLRRSLAWDQGAEMAHSANFEIATGIPVFFCDPHSPWQRGSNENLNGLIRDFYPKGTDFTDLTDDDITTMQDLLNTRPRKTLGYATPAAILNTYINTVATTD